MGLLPDYSNDIAPTMLGQYQRMVNSGMAPVVAHSLLTQPSYPEGRESNPNFGTWPYPYQGSAQEWGQPDRSDALNRQMWGAMTNRQQNLPTYEGHTPGDDGNLGFYRLPSGQYLPNSNATPFLNQLMQRLNLGAMF